MKRVTGIGGVFGQARDPATLPAWYRRRLGIDVQDWGGATSSGAAAEARCCPGLLCIGSRQPTCMPRH